jgi:hypothetical protein
MGELTTFADQSTNGVVLTKRPIAMQATNKLRHLRITAPLYILWLQPRAPLCHTAVAYIGRSYAKPLIHYSTSQLLFISPQLLSNLRVFQYL